MILNYPMVKFEVGKTCFPPGLDGAYFDLNDTGAIFIIYLSTPTEQEIEAFKAGLSFQYVVVEDIIFLLCKMGFLPWMDAPYYRHLSRHLSHIVLPSPRQGTAVHVMLVDGSTGILVAQKFVSLDYELSMSLLTDIANQPEIPDYDTRLNLVIEKYTTMDLLRKAVNV